ncbi:MAG TPA: hypothetical protein DCY13_07595 [Verrucomicrobiales bacterium]|nr:hypothetical protein [Verrucomicrobiales bacterium]
MKRIWLVLLLVMNVLWAAAYACFKLLAPVMDAGTLATLRFGLSALIISFVWRWIPGVRPRGWDLFRTGLLGVMVFCAAPRLQVSGVQLGKAGDAAILMAFDPVIAAVFAAIFLREHVPLRRWLGFSLGLVGVAVLAEFWRPDFQWPGLVANALILASFVCESVYSIVGKPLIQKSHPLKVLAAGLLIGTAANLVFSGKDVVRSLPHLGASDWLALGYLVIICTVVGYSLWFFAVRETPVNAVAMTVFAQPLAGVLFALVLVAEPLRWSQLAGGVVIALGLYFSLPAATSRNRFAHVGADRIVGP